MVKLAGYRLIDWPFTDYKYVSDLIDFEGPILVHYMNEQNHVLFYWVEGDKNYNRWLCFEVTLSELYNYLNKNVSLRELIDKKEHESFFTTDIDNNLKYTNFYLLNGYAIPEKYYPDKESYYIEDIPDFYDSMFKNTIPRSEKYLEFLRTRTLDLEIKPPPFSRYADTVSVNDSIDFLHGFNTSFKHFTAYNFFNQFKNQYTDANKLTKITNKIVSSADLRLVNAAQHSFQISVSIDMIMEDVKQEFIDFKRNIINKYQDDVLNLNYSDDKTIDTLIEKYDDSTRSKIFEPLIKIINNGNFDLTIINKRHNKRKTFPKINPLIKNKILHKTKNEEPPPDLKKVFVTITMELNANADIATISKKDIQQGTLFSKVSNEIEQEIQKFDLDKYIVVFKKPIVINIIQDNGVYIVQFEPLGINVTDTSRDNAYSKLMDEFESLITRDYMSKKPVNSENKKFFEKNVVDIVVKKTEGFN